MSAQPPTDTTTEPWTSKGSTPPDPTESSASWLGGGAATPERPKRRWGPILGGAAGAIVAAVIVAVVTRPGSSSMPSVDRWTAFSDPDGRFTVSMPKQPERTTQQESAAGLTLDIIVFTAAYSDSAVVVGYSDYPDDLELGTPEQVLDGATQGAAEATEGTVISSMAVTVAGRPAMNADIQSERGRALSTFVLDGRRLYVLTTAGRESRNDVQRHLSDSFTLTGG